MLTEVAHPTERILLQLEDSLTGDLLLIGYLLKGPSFEARQEHLIGLTTLDGYQVPLSIALAAGAFSRPRRLFAPTYGARVLLI